MPDEGGRPPLYIEGRAPAETDYCGADYSGPNKSRGQGGGHVTYGISRAIGPVGESNIVYLKWNKMFWNGS